MNNQIVKKMITSVTPWQVFYSIAGVCLLVFGIANNDWKAGMLSMLLLYQGIFNTCLFGSCNAHQR